MTILENRPFATCAKERSAYTLDMKTVTNTKALATISFRTDDDTGYRIALLSFPSSFAPGGFSASPERTVSLALSRGDLVRTRNGHDCVFETTGDFHSAIHAMDAYNARAA